MKNITQKFLIVWLLLAGLITLVFALEYLLVQQTVRLSANDPQIQMAEDIAAELGQGKDTTSLSLPGPIDLQKSLAPFVIITDSAGTVSTTTASLNGQSVVPPKGVLDAAQTKGEDRVTWQPQAGVREAIVVVPFSGTNSGFVIAGRSLREVEIRQNQLQTDTLLVWGVSILIILALAYVLSPGETKD